MHAAHRAVFVAACCLAIACGSGGKDASPGCNQSALRVCTQTHDTDRSEADLRAECEQFAGVWEPCPEAGRTGTCEVTMEDSSGLTETVYAGYICSAEEGEALCGKFTAGTTARTFTPGDAICGAPVERTITCDLRSAGDPVCVDFSGAMPPERADYLRSLCGVLVVDAPCPTAGAVASCEFWDATRSLTVSMAYYDRAELIDAEERCALSHGTWTTRG